ncbi:unannotated protein [freshwater metagenome]|uniref:Unannotated protein n=1 Tax=freshwater metagenome TaxID=449393 RepID=A0A6J7F5I3_9ZZZZ
MQLQQRQRRPVLEHCHDQPRVTLLGMVLGGRSCRVVGRVGICEKRHQRIVECRLRRRGEYDDLLDECASHDALRPRRRGEEFVEGGGAAGDVLGQRMLLDRCECSTVGQIVEQAGFCRGEGSGGHQREHLGRLAPPARVDEVRHLTRAPSQCLGDAGSARLGVEVVSEMFLAGQSVTVVAHRTILASEWFHECRCS